MKKTIAIIGVILGLGVLSASQAHADDYSNACTNGFANDEFGTWIGPVFIGYEISSNYNGEQRVLVCYRVDGTAGELIGGNLYQWHFIGADTYGFRCEGDRAAGTTVATVDCFNTVTLTDPSSNPGMTVSVSTWSPVTGPLNVGQTGAEVGPGAVPVAITTGGGGPICVDGTCPTAGVTVAHGATIASVWINGVRTDVNVP